jgi:hypothetical protein
MNPFIGTFIGWVLSFIYGRISSESVISVTGGTITTYHIVKSLIPSWAIGQTWGRIILIKNKCDGPRLRRHESVHVDQWNRLGWFGLGFMVAYLWENIKHGYNNNKYEKEAQMAE